MDGSGLQVHLHPCRAWRLAVREYPLRWKEGGNTKRGFADYLLYADGRAIGVMRPSPPVTHSKAFRPSLGKYTDGLHKWIPAWNRPLPFAYESTARLRQFTNGLDPLPRSREIFTFHRPKELLRLQHLKSAQLREMLAEMPELPQGKLWPVQHEAIGNLERSLAHAKPWR